MLQYEGLGQGNLTTLRYCDPSVPDRSAGVAKAPGLETHVELVLAIHPGLALAPVLVLLHEIYRNHAEESRGKSSFSVLDKNAKRMENCFRQRSRGGKTVCKSVSPVPSGLQVKQAGAS